MGSRRLSQRYGGSIASRIVNTDYGEFLENTVIQKAIPRINHSGESIFDNEYRREFEVKIAKDLKVV
jgi:hypothetical protein